MDTHITITENELLAALSVTTAVPDNAKTARELAAETGWGIKRVREGLQRLADEKRLLTYQVRRIGIDGRNAVVSAYAVLAK